MARVALAIVHPTDVAFDWHRSVFRTLVAGRHQFYELEARSGVLIARARNALLDQFLEETDADYILWTDSDIVWQPEDVDTLVGHDLPVVGGLYYGKNTGEKFPVYVVKEEGRFVQPDLPPTGVTQVAGVGMGFTLVRRDVAERLKPIKKLWPFAEIEYGDDALGEDTTFCVRAARNGDYTYLDPDVRVGHVKAVTL